MKRILASLLGFHICLPAIAQETPSLGEIEVVETLVLAVDARLSGNQACYILRDGLDEALAKTLSESGFPQAIVGSMTSLMPTMVVETTTSPGKNLYGVPVCFVSMRGELRVGVAPYTVLWASPIVLLDVGRPQDKSAPPSPEFQEGIKSMVAAFALQFIEDWRASRAGTTE